MHPDDVRALYDTSYAALYDQRFLEIPWSLHGSEFQVELIGRFLESDSRWLDVACGTGWFFSRFPDHDRTGLDLSPAMLEYAAEAAPGARFVEGDFRDPHPDLANRFDLVTSLFWAYGYVDSVEEVGTVVDNLASWTAPDGRVLMPIVDAEDLLYGIELPYHYDDPDLPEFSGRISIRTLIWSWVSPDGARHEDMVAPQLPWMVDRFARHFETVEVYRWPAWTPGAGRRKAIVASGKRASPLPDVEFYPYREVFPPADHPLEAMEEPPEETEPVNLGRPSWRRKVWARVPGSARSAVVRAFDALPSTIQERVDPRKVKP